jgi:hypothetical protein
MKTIGEMQAHILRKKLMRQKYEDFLVAHPRWNNGTQTPIFGQVLL